jgi:predicted GIY-YIG superfamily endonuclease
MLSQMKPTTIYPLVYVLELEDGCWYVGITMDLNRRWGQHLSGDGAKWTQLHKPIRIYDIYSEDAGLALENEVTISYIEKYGVERVKGGSYCGNPPSKKTLDANQIQH